MKKAILLSLAVGMCAYLSVASAHKVYSEDYQITIQNSQFSAMQISVHYDNDSLTFKNLDQESHGMSIKKVGAASASRNPTLQAVTAAPANEYTPNFTVNDVGVYEYWLTGLSSVKGTLTVTGSVASPTASVISSPTATATATPTATVSPTMMPSASPTDSPMPSASPSATASPTPVATVTPTMTPSPTSTTTAAPSMTATPVPSMTPTATPEVTPVPTTVPTPTAAPTASPTSTPEILPGFSVFRQTQCSARIVGNNVQTDRLTSTRLIRGTWSLNSLTQNGQTLSAEVTLRSVRLVNLFFRGTPFFNADRSVVPTPVTATFQGSAAQEILDKAATAWCQSATSYR